MSQSSSNEGFLHETPFDNDITDLLTKGGLISLDINDIRKVLSNAEECITGVGFGKGKERTEQAAKVAIKSMPENLKEFKHILLSISTSADEVTLKELTRAVEVVEAADPEAEIIWGHVIDESLQDTVRVKVIATKG